MGLSDELQLQIYIIIGVVSFFIAGLILAVSLLSYYLAKLYKEKRNENSYLRKHAGENTAYKNNFFSNSALDMDDELDRRYTMHRSVNDPQPPSLRSFGTLDKNFDGTAGKKSKAKESNSNVVKSKPSVVDVSEEFSWRQNDSNGSRFNSSIIMHVHEESIKQEHEGRTAFND